MDLNKTILLDSNVIAGVIAFGKDGNVSKKSEINSNEWIRSISKLTALINKDPDNTRLIVPTPICYELMAWSEKWFKIVTEAKEYQHYFAYSSYDITNKFIKTAARYAYESQIRKGSDNENNKIKTMDPLLAAYSIKFNYPIITLNKCDFPNSHFEVIGIDLLNLISSNDLLNRRHRSILYLLKPKEETINNFSNIK